MSDWPEFSGSASVLKVESEPLAHWLPANTVAGLLRYASEAHGALRCHRFLPAPDGNPIDQSFADFVLRASRYASAFNAVRKKAVVASLLPGLPETTPLIFGAMWSGICLPINPFLDAEAIAGMLKRAGATVLLAEGPAGKQGVFEKLPRIGEVLPDLEIILCGEPGGPNSLEDWVAKHKGEAPPEPKPTDVAACFHTGGTTGLPKIAQLTHANLVYMAFLTGFGGGMRSGDVIPCGMPLFHVGGLIFGGLAPLASGASVAQLGRYGFRDKDMSVSFWRIAERERADILFAPPSVAIAALESFSAPALPRVRHWVSSAAPLPASTHRRFTEVTGIPIKEAWGLTEASLVLTFAPPLGESRPGSVGLRLPYCELAIVPLSGEPRRAAIREPGIVMARSPGVFVGYLGQSSDGLEDAPQIGPERWLNTGDVGYFDEDGYLYLTGRAKDMILRGGHNIDPAVIEEAFGAIEDVASVAAVGSPDARVGELPVCYVTVPPGAKVTPSNLLARAIPAITEKAAHPKSVFILDKMPLTPIGKIDKVVLRRDAALRVVRALYPDIASIDARTEEGGRIAISLSPCPPDAAERLSELGLFLLQSVGTCQ